MPYSTVINRHVFESIALNARIALHVRVLYGRDRITSPRRSSRPSPARCARPSNPIRGCRAFRRPRVRCRTMSTVFIYVLFLAAGFAIGGAYAMWKVNKLASGVLVALAVLAAASGILRLI